jgi:hypothetical protein
MRPDILSNSNSLLKPICYSFAKSQNQMPSKKKIFSNSLLFGLGKRTWHPKIFAKITKLRLQQVGKTS